MRRIVTAVLTLSLAFSFLLATTETANANAIAGGGYSSSYAGESVFTNKAAGETGQFSAIFFNDGTQTWSAGVVGLLICLSDKTTCNVASPNAAYASGWFSSTVYATVSATTAPGQNGFFIYNFTVPAGTAPGTAATFNGDVGLIATGTELRPEGYFQVNTTPAVSGAALTISPTSASVPVSGQQQFTVSGAPAGSTTTWSVNGGCGAVTTNGLFAATATNSPTQPCSVVASAGGLTATASITVFGPATTLVCSASKTSIPADQTSTSIKGTLLDANGNVVANDNSTIIVFTNNTPSVLGASSSTPNELSGGRIAVNGVASKTYTAVATGNAGTGVISLSDFTNTAVTGCSQSITVTAAGAAAKLTAAFYLGTISADGQSTSVLEVSETDANGVVVATDNTTQISISRDSGSSVCSIATPNSTSPTTGAATPSGAGSAGPTTLSAGYADFTIASTTTPGTCSWTATANVTGVSSASATLTTVLSGAANKLTVTANTSPKVADGITTAAVTVALQDAAGNAVTTPGSQVTVTATLGTGCSGTKADGTTGYVRIGAAISRVPTTPATTTVTYAAASATATATELTGLISTNGNNGTGTTNLAAFKFKSDFATAGCTVTFSDGSNITSASATVVFTAGGPANIGCVFSPNPILSTGGSSTSVGTVSVTDEFGNLATAGTFSVTFARITTVGDGSNTSNNPVTSLQTASPQNTSNGIAQFTVKATATANTGTDTYRATTTIQGSTVTTGATAPLDCSIHAGASLTNF